MTWPRERERERERETERGGVHDLAKRKGEGKGEVVFMTWSRERERDKERQRQRWCS